MKLSTYLKHWLGVSIFVVAFLLTAACSKVSPTKALSSPQSNTVISGLTKESSEELLAEWNKLANAQQAQLDQLASYQKLMDDKVKEAHLPAGTRIEFVTKRELCKAVDGGIFCGQEARVIPPVTTPETPVVPTPGTKLGEQKKPGDK